MRVLILFITVMSFPASAAQSPACSLTGLTRDCRFFDDHSEQREIVLPDGSSFSNPRYRAGKAPPLANLDKIVAKRIDPEAFTRKSVALQARMLKAWDALPKQLKVSDEFKAAFNFEMGENRKLREWAERNAGRTSPPAGDVDGSPGMLIPWPPESAEVKNVNPSDLVKYLDKLPAAVKKQIVAGLLDNKNLMDEGAPVKPAPTPRGRQKKTAVLTEAHRQRVSSTFDFSRSALLAEISKGRPFAELTPQEKGFYKKIETVRLTSPEKSALEPACADDGGAFYTPDEHSVTLCPQLFNAPAATLALILGHEMSHSFDACLSRESLLTVNQTEIKKLWDENVRRPLRSDRDWGRVGQQLAEGDGLYRVAAYSTMVDGEDVEKQLSKLGLIEVIGQRVTSEKNDPNHDFMQCLADGPGKWRTVTDKQIQKAVDDSIRMGSPMKKDVMIGKMHEFRHCLESADGESHFKEAVADAWGSKVLGRWLTQHPPSSEAEKIAAVQYIATRACEKIVVPHPKNHSHPDDASRVNEIFLAEARVQKALGCKPDPKFKCPARIGTNGPLPVPVPPKAASDPGATR